MLGRIGARKGVPELLEALSTEALRSRKWYATLAGDGDVQTYVRMAESLELLHLVTFPGWLNQGAAAALIADADILVLPSYAENFPMSVIEALASRVAVVTTAVGTTPELLADGESACFVPVGESAPLATVLAELIDDPVRRHRIAHAGYQVFADNLNIDVLASELCGLYARHLASA
jgi:glycosyltransferase involved in cell wall biosynthesis